MSKNKKMTSLSKSKNIEELAAYWDTHDLSDFESETHEVQFEVDLKTKKHYVALDPELVLQIRNFSKSKGLNIESLVNLWLQQKLDTMKLKSN
jgi:hypothetical protein